MKKFLTVKLPEELAKAVKAQSQKEYISQSDVIRRAILRDLGPSNEKVCEKSAD